MNESVIVDDAAALGAMPSEYHELLVHQLLAHAEGELNGADNYIYGAAPRAPNAFELGVCYTAAADEVAHYMRTADLLSQVGVDASYMLRQRLLERRAYPTELLKGDHWDRSSWVMRGLTSLLVEWATLMIIEEMAQSSYRPLAAICPQIVREERRHVGHGLRITRSFCTNEAGVAEVQEALSFLWPMTLDLFGRGASERSKAYLRWGLRQYSNDEARQRFIDEIAPCLESLGLKAPDPLLNRKFT